MDEALSNLSLSSRAGFITNNDELRIVMVGKTGIGKSATGNTILGRKAFDSKFCARSITVDCKKQRGSVAGQKVTVIDTPGLFDTRHDEETTTKDLKQCVSFAAPGPHVFLVVVRLGRFTEEEKKSVEKIQQVFGQDADKYSMVLFTGGDLLKDQPIGEFLHECPALQELVARCNKQYHVFNNEKEDPSQVEELLQKMRNIVVKNGGSHYTNEMFQEAERAIAEEQERLLREMEEKLERKFWAKYEKRLEQEMKAREKQRQKEYEQYEEREWERKAKEGERQKEERERAKRKLKEQHDKELKEEIAKARSAYEGEARDKAEKSNQFLEVGKILLDRAVEIISKAAGTYLSLKY